MSPATRIRANPPRGPVPDLPDRRLSTVQSFVPNSSLAGGGMSVRRVMLISRHVPVGGRIRQGRTMYET